jgi:hypothetical protein
VRPKYVKEHLLLNFEKFHAIHEQSCIIKEVQYFLVDKYYKSHANHTNVYTQSSSKVKVDQVVDKKKYYNFDIIFDKDLIKLKSE